MCLSTRTAEWFCVYSQSADRFTCLLVLRQSFYLFIIYLSFQKLLLSFCCLFHSWNPSSPFKNHFNHRIRRASYIATPLSTEQAQAPSKLTWKGLRTGYSKIQGSWIYSSQDGQTRLPYCNLSWKHRTLIGIKKDILIRIETTHYIESLATLHILQ